MLSVGKSRSAAFYENAISARRRYHSRLLRAHHTVAKFALARETKYINPVPGAYCIIQRYIRPASLKVRFSLPVQRVRRNTDNSFRRLSRDLELRNYSRSARLANIV